MHAKKNPFYQPEQQWQIRIFIDRNTVPVVEEAFGDMASAISSFEIVEDKQEWYVDVIVDSIPQQIDIATRLSLISGMLNIKTPNYTINLIERKDWISEIERGFPPLNIGKFYVHGSHIKSAPPYEKIELKINAGAAFGSGEHSTTSGCLLALSRLSKHRKFLKILDMGCGSGILALAAAKLWHRPVTGIDIDPVSVVTSKDNARKNHISALVKLSAGDGYNTNLVRKNAKYDLIIANILARPLMKMAPYLKKNLTHNGIAVLSGLLTRQEQSVLSAHRLQGLRLVYSIRQNGWSTLILKN